MRLFPKLNYVVNFLHLKVDVVMRFELERNQSRVFLFYCRLEKMGALESTKVVNKHQAWRLITCIWLHAGVFHLLANMLCLVFIGIRLEQQFGFGMCSFFFCKVNLLDN